VNIAKRLVRLHQAGCNVGVILTNDVSAGRADQRVLRVLIKGKVPTWNGYRVRANKTQVYQHSKTLIIDGAVGGKGRKTDICGLGELDAERTRHQRRTDRARE
jgi:phosphatidylserine/phosphatidylglycerophosphate/cardiolipin synthase-like enzyme